MDSCIEFVTMGEESVLGALAHASSTYTHTHTHTHTFTLTASQGSEPWASGRVHLEVKEFNWVSASSSVPRDTAPSPTNPPIHTHTHPQMQSVDIIDLYHMAEWTCSRADDYNSTVQQSACFKTMKGHHFFNKNWYSNRSGWRLTSDKLRLAPRKCPLN